MRPSDKKRDLSSLFTHNNVDANSNYPKPRTPLLLHFYEVSYEDLNG